MSEIRGTCTMDGRPVTAQEGQTILQVALANGIDIPHLCHDPRLSPTGACRLCLVEIEGEAGLHTSCTRLAAPGMVVRTETEAVVRSRKTTLELLLSEHRVACTTCDADGGCLLQDYAYQYQAAEDRFPSVTTATDAPDNYTTGHKGIDYDPSKCVRCQRCVKICAEVEMAEALTLRDRGARRAGQHGLRPAAQRVHLRDLRPVRQHVPDRRPVGARRQGPGPRQGPGQGPHDLHLLRRRLPDRPERQPGDQPHRARHQRARLRAQRRQHVRQGALRLPVRPFAGAADHAADPRERLLPRGVVGRGAGLRGQAPGGDSRQVRAGRHRVPQFVPLHEDTPPLSHFQPLH